MPEPIKLRVPAAGARALRGTLRPLTAIQTAFMWENRGCAFQVRSAANGRGGAPIARQMSAEVILIVTVQYAAL